MRSEGGGTGCIVEDENARERKLRKGRPRERCEKIEAGLEAKKRTSDASRMKIQKERRV